jgi:hypothetical protein
MYLCAAIPSTDIILTGHFLLTTGIMFLLVIQARTVDPDCPARLVTRDLPVLKAREETMELPANPDLQRVCQLIA